MDYREKYEEALERARQIHNEGKAQCFDVMTKVFPELAEVDDGKIRKWLINLVKSHIRWLEDRVKEQLSNGQIYGGELSKARVSLAWLEKQGNKPNNQLDETSYQAGIKRVLDNPESYGLCKSI